MKFAKLFAGILLIAIGLEVTARIRFFGLDSFSLAKINSFHEIGRSGLIQLSGDLEVSYELKPNLDTYFKLKRFQTNSQGLRDQGYPLVKPARTFRVAVVGASYVMGAAVALDDTFHSILEDRLNQQALGTRFEFINFGVGGYKVFEALAVTKSKALRYNPDLLLFSVSPVMFAVENVQPLREIAPKTYPFFDSYLWIWTQGFLRNFRQAGSKAGPEIAALPANAKVLIRRTANELAALQKATGVLICLVVLEHRTPTPDFGQEVSSAALAHQLGFVDANKPFRENVHSNICAHPLDCHPSRAAHLIFADTILGYLEQHVLAKTD